MGAAPGTRVGDRFELLGELGRGAMGVVYRARELATGRAVALKLLLGHANATQLERFKREAELTASLSHPGIVRVHTAGALDGAAFIAYELVEGCTTLDDLLARGDRDGDARLRLIVEVAQAVGFAHARGVLHRDLKPANVLVDATGRARVADFGVATAVGLERLTMTGAIVGTPMFMAPEQITGGAASAATDVWALGVVLYVALAGVPPFEAESLAELASRICGQRPAPLRAHAPAVPAAVEAVCLRALLAAPAARYAEAPSHVAMRDKILVIALDCAPPWFVALSPAQRPSALLPDGVSFGERPGTYVLASDGAVLEWVDGSFRVAG